MGWTFCRAWTSKKVLVDYLTKPREPGPDSIYLKEETIAKKVVGKVLYFVREQTRREDGVRERVLFVILMESDVRNGQGWGYKDLDEGMGPCEDTCPVEFFDLVPEPPNEYAREFRQRCMVHAQREKMINEKLKVGATITFSPDYKPREAEVFIIEKNAIVVKGLSGLINGHTLYRIPKRHFKHIRNIS